MDFIIPESGKHRKKKSENLKKNQRPKTLRSLFVFDIIGAKENQAAAKQTFDFPAPLTSKRPAKQDKEREARVCECRGRKGKSSGCEADQAKA
ncbi:MAG: hypothetical protein NC432_15620 [Roseburia sp.]|nr:hypothetical protein [Roseburia sp.]MCM1098022.1 hypothetical protein [Ruminococcus flavefaciens]